jgi:phosphatidylserine/phosphatidylglycerophosphate/cardiolipin synthase-like enzyme
MNHYPFIDMNKNECKNRTLPYVCKTKSIRSVGYIMGNSMAEQSLYKAYLDAIRKAEKYIYLEIPNFLTTTRNTETQYNPKNHFVKALVDK